MNGFKSSDGVDKFQSSSDLITFNLPLLERF